MEDWNGEAHGGEAFFYYQVAARVFRGDFIGVVSCNSRETKYRWRKAEVYGAVVNDGDMAIEGQETGRKPNPDIADR